MKDRLPAPGKANRIKITLDDNSTIEGVLSYADDATQEGSAYNKANVLPDNVCETLDLNPDTAEPKDAFAQLAAWSQMPTGYGKITIGVFDGAGEPCVGAKLSGCGTPEPIVDEKGIAVAYVPPGAYTIGVLNEEAEYADYYHGELTLTVQSGQIHSGTVPLDTEYKILTTKVVKFSANVDTIDVFCVGGGGGGQSGENTHGGGGGGGGHTTTGMNITIEPGNEYQAIIGAGGASGQNGGATSFMGITANGGYCDAQIPGRGGDGGSGGGAGAGYSGGTDGADGDGQSSGDYRGGKGQGTTTRPFGDPTAEPAYAAGGNGGSAGAAVDKNPNTGDGGDGGPFDWGDGGAGGSGIVIVRWRLKTA